MPLAGCLQDKSLVLVFVVAIIELNIRTKTAD